MPQERVNKAAGTANDYMTPGNHRAFNDGFDCGVRFAEAEMKQMQSCNTCHVTEVITNGFCNVCGADQNTPKQ